MNGEHSTVQQKRRGGKNVPPDSSTGRTELRPVSRVSECFIGVSSCREIKIGSRLVVVWWLMIDDVVLLLLMADWCSGISGVVVVLVVDNNKVSLWPAVKTVWTLHLIEGRRGEKAPPRERWRNIPIEDLRRGTPSLTEQWMVMHYLLTNTESGCWYCTCNIVCSIFWWSVGGW